MLNLQIAELYADLSIKMTTFNRQLGQIHNRLASFKPPQIKIDISTSASIAKLNLLLQQLLAIQAQAQKGWNFPGGGGPGGGGGGGGGMSPEDRYFMKDYRARGAAARKQAAAAARAAAAQQRAMLAANLARQRALVAGVGQAGTGLGQGLGLGFLASPQHAAGIAIGSGLRESVGTAIDLESKFAEVRRVSGLSADETARLKKELMAISVMQPGATLDDLIKMADIGGRMGLAGKDLTTFASSLAMVKNSVAGMETEDLANNMSRVMHVFQLGPEYIKGFGSALTAMDNATTASASDILKITQGLSGTAAAIGVTLPQVIALSAAMRDVGMTNAVASSSMSQVFRKMATNSAEFAAAAGMDAKEFADAYRRGPMEALSALMRGLAANKDTMQAQEVLKSLGLTGVRTGGMLLQLGQAFDKVAGFTATANDEFTSLKSLLEADAIKGETAAAGLGKLANAGTAFADSIGGKLLPEIKALTTGLLDMTNAANAGDAALDRAAQRNIPKALDWIANHTGTGMAASLLGKVGQASTGSSVEAGKFNGFQRISDWVLGKAPAPPAVAAAAKPPALPAPGAAGGAAGVAGAPGLIPGIGSGNAAWGLGPMGEAIKARLGTAAFIGKTFAGAIGNDLRQIPGAIGQSSPSASVGMSGADFGRKLQEDILNGKKMDEQVKETRNLGVILAEIRDLTRRGTGAAANALLGPD